ncbi:hypothetical protein AND_006896 [Anopheles darlingi]|uniref:Uncharacterized protein n=1 Tax=Anopheles darlingi TaxID=43151 RepID=W5JF66_ANODA|nr:hypothetical protein AND_006896 [Anopheles darlingi]
MEVIEPIAPYLRSGDINQTLIVDALKPIILECDKQQEDLDEMIAENVASSIYMIRDTNVTTSKQLWE